MRYETLRYSLNLYPEPSHPLVTITYKTVIGKTFNTMKSSASESEIVKKSAQNVLSDKKVMDLLKREMAKNEKKAA